MYVIIDYLNRRKRKYDPFAYDLDLSEEELISLFTDITNGVPFSQMKMAPVIKEKIVSRNNSEENPQKPLFPEDISFRLEGIQVNAAQGIKDVGEFVRHTDSMTILRNDGSKITTSVKLGLVYKTDSRNPGSVAVSPIDQFFRGTLQRVFAPLGTVNDT